jgi:DNA-directed RNA polymerase subunit L
MNAPTLYDRFIVPEGQRKVAFVAETKVASAGTFTVQREDHTLGNLIRMCVRAACAAAGGAALGRASRSIRTLNCGCARLARRQLHSDDKVIVAGYQLPHPLVNELKIKARARGARTYPPRCRRA